MKLSLFSYFDKSLSVFSAPIALPTTQEEAKDYYLRMLINSDLEKLKGVENYQAYYVGYFDDKSGDLIANKAVYLFDFRELFAQVRGSRQNEESKEV